MKRIILITVALFVISICLSFFWLRTAERKEGGEAYSEVFHGLRLVIRLDKRVIRLGESPRVEIEIVNIGETSIRLYHGYLLLHIAVYSASTGERIREHPPVTLPVLTPTTLQPNESRTMIYELEFEKPGGYTIASFLLRPNSRI